MSKQRNVLLLLAPKADGAVDAILLDSDAGDHADAGASLLQPNSLFIAAGFTLALLCLLCSPAFKPS